MGAPAILDRELVFVTGKGGVGKTTVAAATALAAAARGRPAIVCELGGQHRLASAFGRTPPPPEDAVDLAPGVQAVSIDPDAALAEWVALRAGRPAAALLGRSGAFEHLVAAAPGARELVVIGKAWDLARDRPERLVVVDGPSSGHAVALLQAPGTYSRVGRGGPIGRQAEQVRAFLADPRRSAIVAACTAAELPVSETIELAAAVERVTGRAIDAVVVDMLLPDRFDAAEVTRVERALCGARDPTLRAAGRQARRAWARARDQEGHLARLCEGLAVPVVELPFLYASALGAPELRALAEPLLRAASFSSMASASTAAATPGVRAAPASKRSPSTA